tara:strand:- start:1334 stop:2641 length:1308 start_codon:yes stop_codon:yes gene_type:complete
MKKILLLLLICFSIISKSYSFIIRDSEIESVVKKLVSPIAKAANQNSEKLKIIIINDNNANAFVTPGQKIFIFSGLISNSKSPNELEGVLAHELGHITGKHHVRIYEQLGKARIISIVGIILGGAATLATGDSDALAAIGGGAQTLSQRSFLNFSRAQEGSADQSGFRFLKDSNKSICGIISFLEFLQSQETLGMQDEYMRSHPVTGKRIFDAQMAAKGENCNEPKNSIQEIKEYKFIQAKLYGFINPENTIKIINDSEYFDQDQKDYALAIANYKLLNLKEGNFLINKLIKKYPNNPYFYELKAQMLRDNGYIKESINNYLKAIKIKPDDSLMLIELSQAQINEESPNNLLNAIKNLKKASIVENQNEKLWYLLSVAYGRNNEMSKSRYASAYSAYLKGDDVRALNFIKKAKKIVKKNSVEWNKLDNLESIIKK